MNREQPIVVLGARGMLGHVVVRCLREKGWSVIESDVRWTPQNAEPEIRSLQAKRVGAVVNAMGSYIQDPDARERDSMQWINGRFPTILSSTVSPQTLLIHASSDAVFGSRASGCLWNDSFSPDTDYGYSKVLAEKGLVGPQRWVIRASLIGPDGAHASKRHLLTWASQQRGKIDGYLNQKWNGITTLSWAELVHDILCDRLEAEAGVLQPGFLPPLSKYSLLKMAQKVLGFSYEVQPLRAPVAIERSLIPNHPAPSLEEQLRRLRDWYPLSAG